TAFQDLQPLIDAFAPERGAVLAADIDAAAAVADPPARLEALGGGIDGLVEAHGDLQAARRLVNRVQRSLQFGEVRWTYPHNELVSLPGQGAARLDERPQHREHLLRRAVAQLQNFKHVLPRR